MGVSSDGILFFGYCWTDENNPLDDFASQLNVEDDDWDDYEDLVLRFRGENHHDNYKAWYEKRKAITEEFGVNFQIHCSFECPMRYLCLNDQDLIASRGYPKKVESFNLPEDVYEKFNKWFDFFGIEKPQPCPSWYLTSLYG